MIIILLRMGPASRIIIIAVVESVCVRARATVFIISLLLLLLVVE
jgi:hypothetical protein